MTQSNFEKNGGTYTKVGNYIIPDLTLPPEEQNIHLGVWGCGCPVDTSAKSRSTDRAGRRDCGTNATLWKINELHSTSLRIKTRQTVVQ